MNPFDRLHHDARHIFGRTALQRAQHDVYLRGLFWIMRERNGKGWPPREIEKVAGWRVVRMLAAMTDRSVIGVARELIDTALKMEEPEDWDESNQQSS